MKNNLNDFKICRYCKKKFYRKDFVKNFNRMITCGSLDCKKKHKEEWTYSKCCPTCGRLITYQANKCHTCASLGKLNSFYRKTHTKEALSKIKLFRKGDISPKKGKTYEEMYGEKKAQKLKRENGLRKKGQKQSRDNVKKRLKRRIPSSLEIKMIEIIKKYALPYKFVGNGSFFIERYCPDFINTNGKKIAIEVYYTKHKELFGRAKKIGIAEWKKQRKELFNKYGWDLLFFDETQVNKDIVEVLL